MRPYLLFCLALLPLFGCKHRHRDAQTEVEDATTRQPKPSAPAPHDASQSLPFAFFIESSGSMFAYSGTTSPFRQVLYELLTRVPDGDAKGHSLSYLTDKEYPYNGRFMDFMKNPDPFAAARQMGVKTTSSELNEMLRVVANRAAQGKVAVLVSDCVYSVSKGDAIAQLDQLKYTTKSTFQTHAKGLDVLVLQLEADYAGNYYDHINRPTKLTGTRPYYVIVMAPKSKMDVLLHDGRYASWQDFRSLRGFKNKAHFTATNEGATVVYSVLPNTGKQGSFREDRSMTTAHAIKGIGDCDLRSSGKLSFVVAADLSRIFADESEKTNANNYTLKGIDPFAIAKVEAYTSNNVLPNDRHYLQNKATHLIHIQTNKLTVAKQSLALQYHAQLPQWIAASSTSDDTNTAKDKALQAKTFGLRELLEGVHEAYHPQGTSAAFFTLPIGVRK